MRLGRAVAAEIGVFTLAGTEHPDLDEARFVVLANRARKPPRRCGNLSGVQRGRARRDAFRALTERAQVILAELQRHFVRREDPRVPGLPVWTQAGPIEFIVDGWHVRGSRSGKRNGYRVTVELGKIALAITSR